MLAVAGAALLALVITLSVVASTTAERSRRAAAQALQESARTQKAPLLTIGELALGAEDFILPPLERPATGPEYAPYRPRLTRWSQDLASKYWVAPRDIATDIVESANDRNIRRLFQDVP